MSSSNQQQGNNNDPTSYITRLQQMRLSDNDLSANNRQQRMSHSSLDAGSVAPPVEMGIYASLNNVRNPQMVMSQQMQPRYPMQKPSENAYLNMHHSPTHSISSNHSGSMFSSNIPQYDPRYNVVYENIDYYSQPQPDPMMYDRKFESNNIKAQPQVPVGVASSMSPNNIGRYAHTPQPPEIEQLPIYENVHQVTGQQAQPQAAPAMTSIYYQRNEGSPQMSQQDLPIYESTVINPGASLKYVNVPSFNHSPTNSISISIANKPEPVVRPNIKYHATR